VKIPEQVIPNAYAISKKVYEGKLTFTEGKRLLSTDNKVNKSTAGDYIYNFRYLLNGQVFHRTLNTASMDYFLENIYKEYKKEGLSNALSALKKHIDYYESIQKTKTTMHHMRALLKKYFEKIRAPILITDIGELIQNIDTVEGYLAEGDDTERLEVSKLIKRGTCFVAYKIGNELRFAPSRFLGYESNKLFKHSTKDIDGRDTNQAINRILDSRPVVNPALEKEYIKYCISLGIKPQPKGGAYAVARKYWKLNLEHDFRNNNELSGEFPEGKIVERTHKARERNTQVIQIAKENFKIRHGKLFCEVCGFDFERAYGQIGKDFIEGHHTIAVSEMQPDHKTKPEDIAMLCANCHRMVHKQRPWLTMDNLRLILSE
jgi:5-methylcytosine-specific restriction protein A